MGNTPSTSTKQTAGQSPASASHHEREGAGQRSNDIPTRRESRRRESIHTLSSAKATAAPPSASLTSATGQTGSASASPSNTRNISASSNSRNRSSTIATPRIQPADSRSRERSMGNDQSAPKRAISTSQKLETPPPPPDLTTSPASRPVDVPGAGGSGASFQPSPLDPSAPPSEAFHLPPASYSRPPRLPLPIEEEVHTPGSPIQSPVEATSPVGSSNEIDEDIPRRSSVISSTVDEEDEPDEFQGYMPESSANGPKVPTIVEWRNAAPGQRIYVTGTFTDWQRKFRLHPNGPSKHKDAVSATLQLPAGTHHIKFLVSDDMICSPDLPTTVDFTNILVNYIEVTPDVAAPLPSKTTTPVTVPATAPSRPLDIRPKSTEPGSSARPPTPKSHLALEHAASPASRAQKSTPTRATGSPSLMPRNPRKAYTSDIPAYLIDLDTWPQPTDSPDEGPPTSPASRFQRASLAAQAQPPPPSLPLFLSKSILNGATPMKDDSSVLIMPNHTVLNHLATTNIKQGVLATSATTRYKHKFLTTIMYKPRSDDGD